MERETPEEAKVRRARRRERDRCNRQAQTPAGRATMAVADDFFFLPPAIRDLLGIS